MSHSINHFWRLNSFQWPFLKEKKSATPRLVPSALKCHKYLNWVIWQIPHTLWYNLYLVYREETLKQKGFVWDPVIALASLILPALCLYEGNVSMTLKHRLTFRPNIVIAWELPHKNPCQQQAWSLNSRCWSAKNNNIEENYSIWGYQNQILESKYF